MEEYIRFKNARFESYVQFTKEANDTFGNPFHASFDCWSWKVILHNISLFQKSKKVGIEKSLQKQEQNISGQSSQVDQILENITSLLGSATETNALEEQNYM